MLPAMPPTMLPAMLPAARLDLDPSPPAVCRGGDACPEEILVARTDPPWPTRRAPGSSPGSTPGSSHGTSHGSSCCSNPWGCTRSLRSTARPPSCALSLAAPMVGIERRPSGGQLERPLKLFGRTRAVVWHIVSCSRRECGASTSDCPAADPRACSPVPRAPFDCCCQARHCPYPKPPPSVPPAVPFAPSGA